jgi:glutamyl-tRNA reductase
MKDMISKMAIISTKIGKSSLELLESLTIPADIRTEKLAALKSHLGVTELVYLATCNRVEFAVVMSGDSGSISSIRNKILDFFFSALNGSGKADFEPNSFLLYSGHEAVKHLFNVTASLDSVVIGESQILGQVKECHRFCSDNNLSGPVLDRLFAAAYKSAKLVRTETELGKCPVSMASLVALKADELLSNMPEAVVAIIGSGPMTPKMAEVIRKKHCHQIIFVNRTADKMIPYAEKYGGEVAGLDEFFKGGKKVNIIISSTSSPEPIFTSHSLRYLMADVEKIYAFDLAIPRDFSSELSDFDNVEIWNLEKLNDLAHENRRERFRTVDEAERLIADQIRQYLKKEITQFISPLFDSALNESMTMAQEGLSNLFQGKLSHLTPNDQELLLYWSRKVLERACYLPARQLAENIANTDIEQDVRLSLFLKNAR